MRKNFFMVLTAVCLFLFGIYVGYLNNKPPIEISEEMVRYMVDHKCDLAVAVLNSLSQEVQKMSFWDILRVMGLVALAVLGGALLFLLFAMAIFLLPSWWVMALGIGTLSFYMGFNMVSTSFFDSLILLSLGCIFVASGFFRWLEERDWAKK